MGTCSIFSDAKSLNPASVSKEQIMQGRSDGGAEGGSSPPIAFPDLALLRVQVYYGTPNATKFPFGLSISNNRLSIPTTRLSIASNRLSISNNRLSVPTTRLSVANNRLSVPNNRLSIPTTRLTISNNRLSIPTTRLSISNNRLSVPTTRLSVSNNRLSIPTKVRRGNSGHSSGLLEVVFFRSRNKRQVQKRIPPN